MHLTSEAGLFQRVRLAIDNAGSRAAENLGWLQQQMDPYFPITMQEETEAVTSLATGLHTLGQNQRLLLADRERTLILARLNLPGSLYDTLRTLQEREISYAQFTHSYGNIPGLEHGLEVQRFDFDRKAPQEIAGAGEALIPAPIRDGVAAALAEHYPHFDQDDLDRLLRILWLNNEQYIRLSPPRRVSSTRPPGELISSSPSMSTVRVPYSLKSISWSRASVWAITAMPCLSSATPRP